MSPELLIVNKRINSETEYPHLLTLPYTDYPPLTRLKTSTFGASMRAQIHFYRISEKMAHHHAKNAHFCLQYFTSCTDLYNEKQDELLFQYIKYGFNEPH